MNEYLRPHLNNVTEKNKYENIIKFLKLLNYETAKNDETFYDKFMNGKDKDIINHVLYW